jgi:hypothetical protein
VRKILYVILIFLGDIDQTEWLPTTELRLFEMNDEVASHALINCDDGTRVRARPQGDKWPDGKVHAVLKQERVMKLNRPLSRCWKHAPGDNRP